jgi:O-antigen ligase
MNTLALNEARGPAWKMIHNVYLEYAVDLGLPGLLLFLMLFWGCLKEARRGESAAAAEDDEETATLRACSRALHYALIGFGVAAVFHPVAYHFYFYCLGGLAVAVGALAYNEDHDAAH